MNEFDGKKLLWVLSGNHVLFTKFYEIGKKQLLTQHPADKYTEESRWEWRRASSHARRRQRLFVLAAQATKLPVLPFLQWAEKALKRHARDSDGDAAIELLSFSKGCFGSIAWFSSRLADRAGGKIVLATAMIFFNVFACCAACFL